MRFSSRGPGTTLVPDQAHTVVTSGFGTFGDDDYVTAARTPDGTLAMAYVPSSRTITVDLSTLSGPVTARWYDPAAGTFTPIPGSPFTNAGTASSQPQETTQTGMTTGSSFSRYPRSSTTPPLRC